MTFKAEPYKLKMAWHTRPASRNRPALWGNQDFLIFKNPCPVYKLPTLHFNPQLATRRTPLLAVALYSPCLQLRRSAAGNVKHKTVCEHVPCELTNSDTWGPKEESFRGRASSAVSSQTLCRLDALHVWQHVLMPAAVDDMSPWPAPSLHPESFSLVWSQILINSRQNSKCLMDLPVRQHILYAVYISILCGWYNESMHIC